MIINCDAKALEWYAGTWLAKDKVAYEEIWDNVDQHTLNQTSFGLPSRLIAKKFVFRLIYGGTEYSYSVDPDFVDVSTSQKFWKKVIESFYNKYKGWASWHIKLMQEATTTGQLIMPTGRVYEYTLDQFGNWPRTTILNYPVQGLGADIMAVARVMFYNRFRENNCFEGKGICTVHDSIVVDVPEKYTEQVCMLFHQIFDELPGTFSNVFNTTFDLPLRCEVAYGPDMKNLTEFKHS